MSDSLTFLYLETAPYFMAPEVFEERYSTKADIWSVGCLAFQMAVGQPPWKSLGFTNAVPLFNHLQGTSGPPESDAIGREGSEKDVTNYREILTKTFDRSPAKRPTAACLLSSKFFEATEQLPDDEASSELFSPLVSATKKTKESMSPQSPDKHQITGVGRDSATFLSPPLPKQIGFINRNPPAVSPVFDTREWPRWARETHLAQADSLAFSEDSDPTSPSALSGSQLVGLNYLTDKSREHFRS